MEEELYKIRKVGEKGEKRGDEIPQNQNNYILTGKQPFVGWEPSQESK